ncbi:hypothetical protein BBJ28_00002161 [Nothophytophthora sp. Chile5]|nr:hypothetical protein BBJ28_00002161 [Nothophytophthora sp. Chile5]
MLNQFSNCGLAEKVPKIGAPACALFRRQRIRVSDETLARATALRFAFDPPDTHRITWKLSPLGVAKCRRIWDLFDEDGDDAWSYSEFQEYMAALERTRFRPEMHVIADSAEVWRMYMSDMCELDDSGRLTFVGFLLYREEIEDDALLAHDLSLLGISLEWEALERLEGVKRLFDEYVDDLEGGVTAPTAQYLLAEIGFVLSKRETLQIIERRHQFARCLRSVLQLKRTLRLFGYRQKSTLRLTSSDGDVQPRICKSGLLKSDAQLLVERLTWFIGEFFRDHLEALPFFHRWFVTLPTKLQLRLGPGGGSSSGSSPPSVVVRLVVLFTGQMDLYQVMQTLGLPSSMQFDHLLQRLSFRWLCSHSLEELLTTKRLALGAQWACRSQLDLRLNRRAWAQILTQISHQLDAELSHERDDAAYVAQAKSEYELKKKMANRIRKPTRSTTKAPVEEEESPKSGEGCNTPETPRVSLIKWLRRVAHALEHSQQLSSMWTFASLEMALLDNLWLRSALSPSLLTWLGHVLGSPGGLAEQWKIAGDSLRAEFATTRYALLGASRNGLRRQLSTATIPATVEPSQASTKPAEPSKPVSGHVSGESSHKESTVEEGMENELLEFYDLCSRHLLGVQVIRAEAGTSRLQVQDVAVSVLARQGVETVLHQAAAQRLAVCEASQVLAVANGRFVDLYGVGNGLQRLVFLAQIALDDYVTRQTVNDDGGRTDVVLATCVCFPITGFLLVGAVTEGLQGVKDRVLVLGFRLYATSVSQYAVPVPHENGASKRSPSPVQVHFSFLEPVPDTSTSGIRSLQPCHRGMTPDSGSVLLLFADSNVFGFLSWTERFSARQMCLAELKQHSGSLIAAAISSSGQYIVLTNAVGRLALLDFHRFPWTGQGHSGNTVEGKRLQLGSCSRSGVPARDNPLDVVRVVHTPKEIKGIAVLSKTTAFSQSIAKRLAANPGEFVRQPITVVLAEDCLRFISRLTASLETSSGSEEMEDAMEKDAQSDQDDARECDLEENHEAPVGVDPLSSHREQRSSSVPPIQMKYRLPPMDWKTKRAASGPGDEQKAAISSQEVAVNDAPPSAKLSRADYDKVLAITAAVPIKGYFQAQAEMARFGGGAWSYNKEGGCNNQVPAPVIPHVKDKYDPDHQDADWGGYVQRSFKKRFYTNQSATKDVRSRSISLR